MELLFQYIVFLEDVNTFDGNKTTPVETSVPKDKLQKRVNFHIQQRIEVIKPIGKKQTKKPSMSSFQEICCFANCSFFKITARF